MSLQEPRPRETLGAMRTLTNLVVCPQMHRVGWHGHVQFATLGTSPSFGVGGGAVDLSVTGKIARGGIVLAAITTLESLRKKNIYFGVRLSLPLSGIYKKFFFYLNNLRSYYLKQSSCFQ